MYENTRFLLRNETEKALVLSIEPEGASYPLEVGEEVCVQDRFLNAPVTLKLGISKSGQTVISIWPGDGTVRVEKDGTDILDLV